MRKLARGVKPKRWVVDVPQEAIDYARDHHGRGDSQNCMVKTAVAWAIPGAKRVMVDMKKVRFTMNGYRYVYDLPHLASHKLCSFESGDEVAPFSFVLRLGEVYLSGSQNAPVGTLPHVRHWARGERLMDVRDDDRSTEIPEDVLFAYLAAHPKVKQLSSGPPRSRPATRSRASHRATQKDRFFGLKLAQFGPGGVPSNETS